MALMDVFTHFSIIRRERRGIRPEEIKRHLATDSLGFPFFAHCIPANLSDDQVLIELLTRGIDYFKLKPSELPKMTILLAHIPHPSR